MGVATTNVDCTTLVKKLKLPTVLSLYVMVAARLWRDLGEQTCVSSFIFYKEIP